ncbi:MAG: 3-phosphoshikimate 1-carboxyvinyltransferase [Gemmatales bacterium]|nr:3-phosphoshikimate 1-carboxyvinyltransferase [Gemmatales bacterium]MDW8175447.1 3-phosphoshikimate 1-carboxyvinyltransferase [Gemmatales bacterium]
MSATKHFPSSWPIRPLAHPLVATVRPPGSKSITNRALVLSALASHVQPVVLEGALFSEDTEVMMSALKQLGFQVYADSQTQRIELRMIPSAPLIPVSQAELMCGNSGTTMRFLTALVSLGHGKYRLDGVSRMRESPIEDLLEALRQLGVEAYSEAGNGCPPVWVIAQGWEPAHKVTVRGELSSQFISGLLLAAPWSGVTVTFRVVGQMVSEPYVDMTLRMLETFGARVQCHSMTGSEALVAVAREFHVPAQQPCGTRCYTIEPDATAATYWWAAAAITGGAVTVIGLNRDSLQGDVRFVELLERMGCQVDWRADRITVQGGQLRGIEVDMNAISDTVMTLAAVACFAEGPTRIYHVAHIRHKETDRLAALTRELRRLGAEVQEHGDGLTIFPRPMQGTLVYTYNDHRMAMSLALVGLRVPGVVIDQPACVAKTYPDFFADLERLCFSNGGRNSEGRTVE